MSHPDTEALRAILENLHHPEMLNGHPWVSRRFVKDAVARLPELGKQSPGAQLVGALTDFFAKTIPPNPPRRGKRLDTRWCEFGLLAAQYFAPLQFGTPIPASLRDAWGRIDQVILFYVFGRDASDSLSTHEIASYKLVGGEPEIAPNSTLSDWHTKGMQKLTDALDAHDQYLSKEQPRPRPRRRILKWALILLTLGLAAFLTWGGFKARNVYDLSMLVWQDASKIRDQASGSPSLETAKAVGPLLAVLHRDFQSLKEEVQPYLWLGPWLDWVPVYGADIASAPDLFDLADSLIASSDRSYQALAPLLDAYSDTGGLDPATMIGLLNQAQPQLTEARVNLDLAIAARDRLDPNRLSPRVRDLLLDDVDRILALLDDGLMLAVEIPRAAGATSEGPKTYLLLAQNEDELRPTGGFITAAGTLLLQDGHIVSLTFQDSGYLENWNRPYPVAPWQLQQYMNSPVLIFRDANWFSDYRTTALYAEFLYSYSNKHSVDGVIAFDQRLLVEILRVTGPVRLEGEADPIDADNVITYMRAGKNITTEELASGGSTNKGFINVIAEALVEKMLSGEIPSQKLIPLALKVLNEHHLLVQVDNPSLTEFLARRGWDGALRTAQGDFLMVVDSNVGFNKTNVLVQTNLSYDVDLTDVTNPRSQLVVSHQNNSASVVPCDHYPYLDLRALGLPEFVENNYPINRCYWNYLRVYTLSDAELLGAAVQTVPAEWTMLMRTVPPQVDVLDEELEGLRGFGTYMVVPGGQSLASNFRFGLPVSVLESQPAEGQLAYRLKIQKQPGTQAVAITVRVHLPNGATIQTVPPGAAVQGQNILVQSTLATDLVLEFVFLVP